MERWQGKVAVVTGASSGIGAQCAMDLAKAGMIVVGLARREGLVADLRYELPKDARNRLHTLKCDVTKECDVNKAFSRIKDKFGGIDVLINNAGIFRQTSLLCDDNVADLHEVLMTNVMGKVHCTREAFKSMKERNVDGHVVNMNSTCGHKVVRTEGHPCNMYTPSKFAITALTEEYRQEFYENKTKIKITSLSPGVVDTNITRRKDIDPLEMLKPKDVSNAVIYILSTPVGVEITELTIKAMRDNS
ncbi:farnesol dehydrogenase isoform X2 [Episyrphus balteatus]|nr:farnesol dehydrogenase isoform X2 [Episyrphus balteatus]XP_055846215.1 farnesol dehydrogenase isoform X2 [Episyrphus balteatus]